MNRKNIAIAFVATALSLGTAASFAEGNNYQTYPDVPVQSTLTRAQVKADLAQAKAEGLIPRNDANYPVIASNGPEKTRAQVKEELAQAKAEGLIPRNDADYPVLASDGPGKTRAQVKEELARARASGELNNYNQYQGS